MDSCLFCGKQDARFKEGDNLDLHFCEQCPMLASCSNCGQIVEISSLKDHYLFECASGKRYRITQNIPSHCLHIRRSSPPPLGIHILVIYLIPENVSSGYNQMENLVTMFVHIFHDYGTCVTNKYDNSRLSLAHVYAQVYRVSEMLLGSSGIKTSSTPEEQGLQDV